MMLGREVFYFLCDFVPSHFCVFFNLTLEILPF